MTTPILIRRLVALTPTCRQQAQPFFFTTTRYVTEFYDKNDIPHTPSGGDPYIIFGLHPASATLKIIAKQYKRLVVENHPDRPGGSTEKMVEINAAYKILKENHERIRAHIKRTAHTPRQAAEHSRSFYEKAKAQREETLHRSGGIRDTDSEAWKSQRSSHERWARFEKETRHAVECMKARFDLACIQGLHMRKPRSLSELVARERWLRRGYIQEMRSAVQKLSLDQSSDSLRRRVEEFGTAMERELVASIEKKEKEIGRANWYQSLRTASGVVLILGGCVLLVYWYIFIRYIPNTFFMKYKDAM